MESSTSERFSAGRRSGVAGRVSFYRGSVRDRAGRDVMRAASPELATLIVRILNREGIEARKVDQPSGLARYSVQTDPRDKRRKAVVGVLSTVRDPSWFGNGLIATTEDPELARRVASGMNELDPEAKKRGTRGIGWW